MSRAALLSTIRATHRVWSPSLQHTWRGRPTTLMDLGCNRLAILAISQRADRRLLISKATPVAVQLPGFPEVPQAALQTERCGYRAIC
jgi:hypothetical protein